MDRTVTDRSRRGVLLLVVLSMLTLFLMLGATYLVAATRARRTARAFADSGVATAQAADGAHLVETAFLSLVRGSSGPSSQVAAGDDLLGDRYGTSTVTGTMTGNASGSIVIAVPVGRLNEPANLAGRVVTFVLPGLGTPSTRIIRTVDSANGTTLYVPGGPTVGGDTLTAARINTALASAPSNKPHVIINGRDFDDSGTNEPYDAIDSSNPFLGKIVATGSNNSSMSATSSFADTAGTPRVDNDGDGTLDSGWIDVGLPDVVDASGNSLKVKVAALIIDLDGRLNVNTHGSTSDADSPEQTGGFGTGKNYYPDYVVGSGTIPLNRLTRGLGLGAAEVAIAGTSLLGPTKKTGLPEMLGGAASRPSTPPDATTHRPTPLIGDPEGRYGDAAWDVTTGNLLAIPRPGLFETDDNSTIDRWVSSSGTANSVRYFEDVYTRYGSPPDVKGRMKVWVDDNGQPVYYKPAWSQPTGRGVSDDEVVDDPYEVDLGPKGSRTAYVATPSNANASHPPRDNLYTVADVEGVLRFYDPDAIKLSRRLVSICRDWTATARLQATTDSWDTPAVVGSSWKDVIGSQFAAILTSGTATEGSRPFDVFAPETIMGHKLDLNRPFHTSLTWEALDEDINGNGKLDNGEDANGNGFLDSTGLEARQQFAKHFYCLLVAISRKNKGDVLTPAEAEQLAQWAVNVVDFRDGDSAMTPFDYDENFTAGSTSWSPTKRVWGCERPELLITETIAWHDRRTDDLKTDSSGKEVKDKDLSSADNDFDQQRRPRGAFFVTLYSPWGSQAKRIDSPTNPTDLTDITKSGTNTPAYRGEPLPRELTAPGVDRFSRSATISLSLRHDRTVTSSGTGSPIWRLVSVRGDVQGTGTNGFGGDGFGKDPVRPSTANTTSGTLSILDPSRPNATATVGSGTAVVDRIFYFTTPPNALAIEKPGCVFWQSGTSTADPSLTKFVVVGTDRLVPTSFTTVNTTGSNATVQRTFDQPDYKPATLSEPTVTTDNVDAYQSLATANGNAQFANTGIDLYAAGYTLNSVLDTPLDSVTSAPAGVSQPFLDASNKPVLMCNGTHPNFAIIHLQRLANPSRPFHPTNNPYLTIDSMTVDLTVVNTNSTGDSLDEPGQTPSPDPTDSALSWLASQKQFRTKSVQRGGKLAERGGPEPDIWNRRVTATATDVNLDTLFRTGTVGPRPAVFNPAVPNVSGVTPTPTTVTLTTTSGTLPERYTSKRFPWLLWANRPYSSPAELASVPTTSNFHLLRLHSTGTFGATLTPPFCHLPGLFETSGTTPWTHLKGAVAAGAGTPKPGIFDFVHAPTRFGGSYVTIPLNATTTPILDQHGLADQPYNHFSLFREPGRININTVFDDKVRNALFGTTSGTTPAWNTSDLQSSPKKSWLEALKSANAAYVDTFTESYRNSDLDSFFRHQTAGRLANIITPRSNVFAVWVTIGYFDGASEATPIQRHRGFFILDRSIPVGYQSGKDLNVRDAIVLRRIIE
jgi:hypothetical protein